jgi:hypothetical protein
MAAQIIKKYLISQNFALATDIFGPASSTFVAASMMKLLKIWK